MPSELRQRVPAILITLCCAAFASPLQAEDKNADKRGAFTATFTHRAPASDLKELAKDFGLGSFRKLEDYELSKRTFELYVPKNYQPHQAFGLLVFLTPNDKAKLPRGDWGKVMEDRRLIYVGVPDLTEKTPAHVRLGLALDAIHNAKRRYAIDDDRLYVFGHSSAAEVAGALWVTMPDVVDVAVFLNGSFTPPTRGRTVSVLRQSGHVVFVVNKQSKSRSSADKTYNAHYKERFKNAARVVPDLKDENMPTAKWLNMALLPYTNKVLEAADGKLMLAAARKFERARSYDRAWEAFVKTGGRSFDDDVVAEAEAGIGRLRDVLDKQVADIQKQIAGGAQGPARVAITRLETQWGLWAAAELDDLNATLAGDKPATTHADAKQLNPKGNPSTPSTTDAPDARRMARQRQADEQLAAARERAADDLAGAYQALQRVAERYAGTPAGRAAKVEVAQYDADPDKRTAIRKAIAQREAAGLLSLANAYLKAGKKDEAIEKLEALVDKHGDTDAGREAKAILSQLRGR